jgi:hypothetical protein
MLDDHLINVDGYFAVMVNDNHYTCLGYFCMFIHECKPSHVNQLKMDNNLLNST